MYIIRPCIGHEVKSAMFVLTAEWVLTSLHAVVAGDDLAAVRAGVDDILATFHAEGDQAAAKTAANNTEDDADNPGECARLISSGSHNVCSAVRAHSAYWSLTECLHNSHGWLGDHNSVCGRHRLTRLRGVACLRWGPIACLRWGSIPSCRRVTWLRRRITCLGWWIRALLGISV